MAALCVDRNCLGIVDGIKATFRCEEVAITAGGVFAQVLEKDSECPAIDPPESIFLIDGVETQLLADDRALAIQSAETAI